MIVALLAIEVLTFSIILILAYSTDKCLFMFFAFLSFVICVITIAFFVLSIRKKTRKHDFKAVHCTKSPLDNDVKYLNEQLDSLAKRRSIIEKIEKQSPNPSPAMIRNHEILNNLSLPLEERNRAYSAIRDEEEQNIENFYDLNSVEGIESIPVPCIQHNGYYDTVTGRVEYYLRVHGYYRHLQNGNKDLVIACLYKAQELRYYYNGSGRKSYLRLVQYLYEFGRDEEADYELARVNEYFEKHQNFHVDSTLRGLLDARNNNTDLVQTTTSIACCEECAKYVNRVYSVSGKDKRFPKLPSEFYTYGGGHHFSCLSVCSYHPGFSPLFECSDVIEYSNRPFVDERSAYEIERYEQWHSKMVKRKIAEKKQEESLLEWAKQNKIDTDTLNWIHDNLPELCPKSVSSLRQIRTRSTKTYQKIVEEAKKLGMDL